MAEQIDDKKVFSLSEVAGSIQKTLAARYRSSYWIRAEMIKLHHYPHSGHCYPEFVEKRNGRVVAQLKATLWKEDYLRINARFMEVLKEPLRDGITILFCARITFEPLHGLSLRILDVDPAFSLGELERMKLLAIQTLKDEGVFTLNRARRMAVLPQRIAVISVQTSKGYADFIKVIEENSWGYRFFHMLFPSLLQGDNAVESIRGQLALVRRAMSHFDVVAIIRGGGGDIGLSCFNNVSLSREIAMFPLPVITGIGHATNETVVEMVAHKNAITPTELADYLLQKFHDFAGPVRQAGQTLRSRVPELLRENQARFRDATRYFRSLTGNMVDRSVSRLGTLSRSLFYQARFLVGREHQKHMSLVRGLRRGVNALSAGAYLHFGRYVLVLKKDIHTRLQANSHRLFQAGDQLSATVRQLCRDRRAHLDQLARTVDALNPDNVLKRGYSITRYKGKVLRRPGDVKPGDIVETTLFGGTVESEIKSTDKSSAS